jgi:Zn-dependent peptidase ImmA (M78 family)/DNA-binding XRE family transcriptional regulator
MSADVELKKLFGQRLRNARIMRGFSMDELCKRMGNKVSKQAISKYESGKMFPDSSVHLVLADALEMKPDYFLRPFSDSIGSIEFRKKSKLGIRQIDSIREIVRDKIERYLEVEEILGIDSEFEDVCSLKEVSSQEDVFAIAEKVRKDWSLGEGGIPSVIELMENHKIKVIEIDAPDAFDGMSGFIGGKRPVIILNWHYTVERKRFTALHELGHILLHFSEEIKQKEKECLCNTFANELLIPAKAFNNIIGDKRHDISLKELRDVQVGFGVSVDALMFKAKYLGVISEQRYQYYCMTKNRNKRFKDEVEESLYHQDESHRFDRLVYKALACDLISYSKAAVLLNKPLNVVREELELV